MSYLYSQGIFESIIFLGNCQSLWAHGFTYHVGTQGQILGTKIHWFLWTCGRGHFRPWIWSRWWNIRDQTSSPFSLEVTIPTILSSGHWNSPGPQKKARFLAELPREMYNCISSTNMKGHDLKHCFTVENEASQRSQEAKFCDHDFLHCEPTVDPVWPQYTCPKIPNVPPNRIGICYWNSTFRVGMKKIFETTT